MAGFEITKLWYLRKMLCYVWGERVGIICVKCRRTVSFVSKPSLKEDMLPFYISGKQKYVLSEHSVCRYSIFSMACTQSLHAFLQMTDMAFNAKLCIFPHHNQVFYYSNPSSRYPLNPVQGCRGAGPYPSCHCVRGRVHPRRITSSSQDQHRDKQPTSTDQVELNL